MSDDPFPDWSKPATKGDIIQVAVWSRSTTVKLAAVAAALYADDKELALKNLHEYFTEQEELGRKIDELGGKKNG